MLSIPFTVDSALLKEIGERLVGKPYIALAELVKNSYDADAPTVTININPKKDQIIVEDTGNGMTEEEFKDFWMRIGSTHKVRQKVSRNFHRPLTGSKGIGRLAVQYLAEKMELVTTSEYDLNTELRASVNWVDAVHAGELVKARVNYEIKKSANGFKKGTKIILKILKHEWDEKQIELLATEIWWLQPPFKAITSPKKDENSPNDSFLITFKSESSKLQKSFEQRISVALNLWNARIIGKNEKGNVSIILEFKGKKRKKHKFKIPDCKLVNGTWEIRIFLWQGRQTYDIKVGVARQYFNKWGGVHVYDTGFRLPYHGDPKNDWLGVELDHSHRLTTSQLLPKEWQTPLGMQMLPTLSRILGVVNVNTSEEPELFISLDRERLQESEAYRNLQKMVRFGLDWYAIEEKKRTVDEKQQTTTVKVQKIEDVLTEFKQDIKPEVFNKLEKRIIKTAEEIQTNSEKIAKQVGLVGSLATAGITSVAYQHELKRQFTAIEQVIEDLEEIKIDDEQTKKNLRDIKEKLTFWLNSAKSTNNLFGYFSDTENIQIRKRFPAKKIVEEVKEQLSSLARGIPIETEQLDENLLLPEASLLEWSAIFQNVIVNAFNAVMDSTVKSIEIVSRKNEKYAEILVQDTGSGVDLKKSDELFQPFVRKINISPERRALGYGGMGLGLTIVKLVANNIGCEVSFVKPEKNFNTAFSIKWRG